MLESCQKQEQSPPLLLFFQVVHVYTLDKAQKNEEKNKMSDKQRCLNCLI